MNDDQPAAEKAEKKVPAKSLQAKLDALQTRQIPVKDETEAFETPEEVAAHDDITEPTTLTEDPSLTETEKPAVAIEEQQVAKINTFAALRARLNISWPFGKREWLASAIIVLVCGSLTALILLHINSSKPVVAAAAPIKKVKKVAVAKPTVTLSTLSGLPVDPAINQKPVTGVMIENSVDARPQSGLSQASVVFEAIAEGGVTRFLTLFQDTSPDNIGPIRSARPYYVQWALGFDAGYAHVGGSPDGLALLKSTGARDLDQFANGGSYHRISTRVAPHNVYTAVSTLNQLEAAKGYVTSTYTGFVRKAKETPAKVPTAKSIDMNISGPAYNPHYDYDAATNSYKRSEGGAAHIDANTNTQISPKVVVAMIVPQSQGALDSSNAYYTQYAVIGSGAAYVFQDGTVTIGTWSKSANTSQITFSDSAGKPLGLNPGQTWLTALGDASRVSYTP